ncbi:MAG: trypsin-like serine protease [Archangiaceae bacterium]|nr:trypsin-like serine protease [Archangiaceae bacterium]
MMTSPRSWQFLLSALLLFACDPAVEGPALEHGRSEIIGGSIDAGVGQAVAVFINPALPTGVGFCSGFLIAPNVVMTARHCVSGMSQSSVICADETVGSTTYTATRALDPVAPSRFSVTSVPDVLATGLPPPATARAIHVPPQSAGAPNCGTDVALIELTGELAGATPLPLRASAPQVSEPFAAVGYGNDGATPNTDGVRRGRSDLSVTMVGEVRSTSGRLAVTANDWVADRGPCGGDSGGPAIDPSGQVMGVMSRGNPTVCAQMIYTQVGSFREWAKQVVVNAADAGHLRVVAWVDAELPHPDAGAEVDAGTDAGTSDVVDAGTMPPAEEPHGCTAAAGAPLLLGALLLLSARRNRNRNRNRAP